MITLCVGPFAVRLSSNGCRYRNGGCEHFCREFPDRSYVCFCAPGYRLDQDNSTCLPQGKRPEDNLVIFRKLGRKEGINYSLFVNLSCSVKVPCGRPQIHFSPRVINGLICPKGHCPWQVNTKLMNSIRKTVKQKYLLKLAQLTLPCPRCTASEAIFWFNVALIACKSVLFHQTDPSKIISNLFFKKSCVEVTEIDSPVDNMTLNAQAAELAKSIAGKWNFLCQTSFFIAMMILSQIRRGDFRPDDSHVWLRLSLNFVTLTSHPGYANWK